MNLDLLPRDVPAWLQGHGKVVRLERSVARREAWIVDLEQPGGEVLAGFLRFEREPVADNPWSLAKETGIVRALAATPLLVPLILAENARLHCTLFERISGRSDLHAAPPDQQRAVMEDFIDLLAMWHTLDPATLFLPPMQLPVTSRECAMNEMNLITSRYADFLSHHCDPLITYGIQWLERFAPPAVHRISLLQGDTGPGNFLFDGKRVTAVIDWEWGHLGDPMEDLGNICVRNFWNPCGPLNELFPRYEERSGITVDLAAVRYYRVQQNMRGMVPIAAETLKRTPSEPLAWALAYRYIGDRATVEAMAEAMAVRLDRPYLPEGGDDGAIAAAAVWSLEKDVVIATKGEFAQSRAREAALLVRCLDRLRRFEAWAEREELDDMAELIGRRPASLEAGLAIIAEALRAGTYDDDAVLRYLGRRAYRLEWLYAPVTALYPAREWTPLE